MKNNFNPRVSIVIPVYNGADYLGESIESALNQTYKNIEVIVVNDGSNDNGATRKVAISYGNRIRYYDKDNGGVATALNFAIDRMTGDYFSWLSHDDLYYNSKIEHQIEFLKNLNNSDAIVYSDVEIIDESANHIRTIKVPDINPDNFRFWITTENLLNGCTLLIPKECFNTCGKFNTELITTQDYDLWFRMAKEYIFLHLPMVLVKSRWHENQTTNRITRKVMEECNELMIRFMNGLDDREIIFKNQGENKYIVLGTSFYKNRFYLAAYRAFATARKTSNVASIGKWLSSTYYQFKSLAMILFKQRFLLEIHNNELKA